MVLALFPFLIRKVTFTVYLGYCVRACESTCRRYWNDFTEFHEILYKLQAGGGHAMCVQGGSNMTGTDLCVNKPHCAVAVRP